MEASDDRNLPDASDEDPSLSGLPVGDAVAAAPDEVDPLLAASPVEALPRVPLAPSLPGPPAFTPIGPVLAPPPRPKPPIRPETVGTGFRTDGLLVEPAGSRAWFVTVSAPGRAPQRIYVPATSFEHLLALAAAPIAEPGKLWAALCAIPLERPLPSRRLEDELRALLTTFAVELRGGRLG